MIKWTNSQVYCKRSHTCNARNLFNSRKLYKRSKNKYYTAINKTQSRIDRCVCKRTSNTYLSGTREPKKEEERNTPNADGLRELCVNIRILKSLVESEIFFQQIMMLCPVQICHKFSKRFNKFFFGYRIVLFGWSEVGSKNRIEYKEH